MIRYKSSNVWWGMNQLCKSKPEQWNFMIKPTLDLYKSLMIIEHLYPLTYFQNSRIVEIHRTIDDSRCDLWNDKKLLWIVESYNPLSRGKSDFIYNLR